MLVYAAVLDKLVSESLVAPLDSRWFERSNCTLIGRWHSESSKDHVEVSRNFRISRVQKRQLHSYKSHRELDNYTEPLDEEPLGSYRITHKKKQRNGFGASYSTGLTPWLARCYINRESAYRGASDVNEQIIRLVLMIDD